MRMSVCFKAAWPDTATVCDGVATDSCETPLVPPPRAEHDTRIAGSMLRKRRGWSTPMRQPSLLRGIPNRAGIARERMWRRDIGEGRQEWTIVSGAPVVRNHCIRLDPTCPLDHDQNSPVLTRRKGRA